MSCFSFLSEVFIELDVANIVPYLTLACPKFWSLSELEPSSLQGVIQFKSFLNLIPAFPLAAINNLELAPPRRPTSELSEYKPIISPSFVSLFATKGLKVNSSFFHQQVA